MHDNLPELHEIKAIKTICAVVFYIGYFIFYVNSFRWFLSITPILLKKMRLDCRSQVDGVAGETDTATSSYHLYPLLYVVATSLTSAITVIMNKTFPQWDAIGLNSISYHNLLTTAFPFLVIYISEKMTKYEIIQGLVSTYSNFILVPISHVSCSYRDTNQPKC